MPVIDLTDLQLITKQEIVNLTEKSEMVLASRQDTFEQRAYYVVVSQLFAKIKQVLLQEGSSDESMALELQEILKQYRQQTKRTPYSYEQRPGLFHHLILCAVAMFCAQRLNCDPLACLLDEPFANSINVEKYTFIIMIMPIMTEGAYLDCFADDGYTKGRSVDLGELFAHTDVGHAEFEKVMKSFRDDAVRLEYACHIMRRHGREVFFPLALDLKLHLFTSDEGRFAFVMLVKHKFDNLLPHDLSMLKNLLFHFNEDEFRYKVCEGLRPMLPVILSRSLADAEHAAPGFLMFFVSEFIGCFLSAEYRLKMLELFSDVSLECFIHDKDSLSSTVNPDYLFDSFVLKFEDEASRVKVFACSKALCEIAADNLPLFEKYLVGRFRNYAARLEVLEAIQDHSSVMQAGNKEAVTAVMERISMQMSANKQRKSQPCQAIVSASFWSQSSDDEMPEVEISEVEDEPVSKSLIQRVRASS